MTNEPDNIVLVHLRRIDKNVSEMKEDMRNIQTRMTGMEKSFGELRYEIAETNHRIDRLANRVERVEKRLDIYDSSFAEGAEKFKDQDD